MGQIGRALTLWMTSVTCYKTFSCKKLHGKLFEGFIRNARSERYNIMCSIDAYKIEHT